MKLFLSLFLLVSGFSTLANITLIECSGSGNRNAGEVRVVLDNQTGLAKVLLSAFDKGTKFYHLKDVPVNLRETQVINHINDGLGLRIKIDISKEILVAQGTIRPYPTRSRVYVEYIRTGETLINGRRFECKKYNI